MRRSVVIVGVLVLLAFLLIGGPSMLTSVKTNEVAPEENVDNRTLIRPAEGDSGFWPYLNAQPRFQKRSPINIVVIGDTEDIVRLLVESSGSSWQITPEDQQEADPRTHALTEEENVTSMYGNVSQQALEEGDIPENETADHPVDQGVTIGGTNIRWSRATGATRYAYVQDGQGNGQWITETTQVHDGTYYGQRFHARIYESPDENESWVAMQAHEEHFDWFTLRHRVHGSQAAQTRMERDFMDTPQINVTEDVSRVYLGNRNSSDADGWATFIRVGTILAGAAVVTGSIVGREGVGEVYERLQRGISKRLSKSDRERLDAINERIEVWHFVLGGVIVGLVLGVRAGGILLERNTTLSVYEIAGTLYPFIALGLPVGAYVAAGGLEHRMDAAVVAGGSFALAVWLDYGWLGVQTIPVDVVVQRMLLVVALGLIAAGAAQRATRESRVNVFVVCGGILWLLVVIGTLLGYV